MDDWLDGLADALGVRSPGPMETRAILKVSREVAHGVERKLAPLSTFVLGVHVGRAEALGGDPGEAFREAVAAARRMLPADPESQEGPGTEGHPGPGVRTT